MVTGLRLWRRVERGAKDEVSAEHHGQSATVHTRAQNRCGASDRGSGARMVSAREAARAERRAGSERTLSAEKGHDERSTRSVEARNEGSCPRVATLERPGNDNLGYLPSGHAMLRPSIVLPSSIHRPSIDHPSTIHRPLR